MKCREGGTWSQGIIGSVAEPPTLWASAPWSFVCEKVRKNTADKFNLIFFFRFMNKYFESIKYFVELQCDLNDYFPVPGPFEALNRRADTKNSVLSLVGVGAPCQIRPKHEARRWTKPA